MKWLNAWFRKTLWVKSVLALGCLVSLFGPARACTIFVLTDATRSLFFNNEDWSNPASRIWFVPAGQGYLGCAYVGFDNGWAQGGVNTAGLAFDWVTGFTADWKPKPALKTVRGNPSQRMLETCSTVTDAIAFYHRYWEPDFARSRILIADRTGASVILSANAGLLQVDRSNQCRGFGWGHEVVDQRLANPPEPTVANGLAILRAALQPGEFATKYSSVYDLKSGDLYLAPVPTQPELVKLNLATELQRGAHYYELPRIQEQLSQAPLALPPNMVRFYLDELKPLPDQDPAITQRLRTVVLDVLNGSMRDTDYTPEMWQKVGPSEKQLQAEMKPLGKFLGMTLVDRTIDGTQRSYFYLMNFQNAQVLQRYILDEQNKVALIHSEFFEAKLKEGSLGE